MAVAARTLEQVEQVAGEIAAGFNLKALPVACDVSDPASVEQMYAKVYEVFGRGPDILVNNAGIAESAPLTKTDNDLWHRHLAVNLSGTFYCTRAAIPQMIERGWGRVINIASIAGKTGAPYIVAYSASKHGVLGLTRSAAIQMAKDMAFAAEQRGDSVELLIQGYYGDMSRKLTGGTDDD